LEGVLAVSRFNPMHYGQETGTLSPLKQFVMNTYDASTVITTREGDEGIAT